MAFGQGLLRIGALPLARAACGPLRGMVLEGESVVAAFRAIADRSISGRRHCLIGRAQNTTKSAFVRARLAVTVAK